MNYIDTSLKFMHCCVVFRLFPDTQKVECILQQAAILKVILVLMLLIIELGAQSKVLLVAVADKEPPGQQI